MTDLKQGDMVMTPSGEREFITMTNMGKYLCWNSIKTDTIMWSDVTKIEPKVYYYQYEKLNKYGIETTNHRTDKQAEDYEYTEANGWYKIEDSKREWKH